MDHPINDRYTRLLERLEVEFDLPAQSYLALCQEAASAASERMVINDPIEDQLYFPKKGVPGLNDIAHALVTGFMQMGEGNESLSQDLYPDLVNLFFIAGDYSSEYRAAAYNWMQSMTPEQRNEHPEHYAMWMVTQESDTYVPSLYEQLVERSGSTQKLPLIKAISAGNEEDAKSLADALPQLGALPGWEGFPFTSMAVRALLLRH